MRSRLLVNGQTHRIAAQRPIVRRAADMYPEFVAERMTRGYVVGGRIIGADRTGREIDIGLTRQAARTTVVFIGKAACERRRRG